MAQQGQKWATGGNNISNGDFLGTKNNKDLKIKVNNALQLTIKTDGLVKIQDRLKVKNKITTDTLKVNNKIKAPYLSGNGISLLKVNNNGVIKPFLFPSDTNMVLYGSGNWKPLPPDNGWQVDGNNMYSIPTGNIGIGTTTPARKLDVNGSVFISDTLGIGVSAPQASLDVQGNVIVRGWLYAQNGVVVGKRFEGEKIQTDTVKTTKSIAAISETDTLTSQKINADKIKVQGIIINGPNNKIYSTTGDLSFNNTNLNDVGTLNANTVHADNLQVDYTSFDSLRVIGKLKIGTNSLIIGNNTYTGFDEILSDAGKIVLGGSPELTDIKVGIGTDDPLQNLHIKGTTCFGCPVPSPKSTTLRIEDQVVDDGGNLIGSSFWDVIVSGASDSKLYFQSSNATNPNDAIMTLTQNGTVGIGTENPQELLHIEGQYAKARIGYGENYLKVGYNSAHAIIESHGTDVEHGKLLINWYSGNNVVVGGGDGQGTTPTGNFTSRHNTYLATVDGNVGIGTDAPQKKLHVRSFVDLTINPAPGPLGSVRIEDEYYDGTTTKPSVWDIEPMVQLDPLQASTINPSAPVKLNIGTPGAPVLTLLADGKVGIGTENPKEKLQIGDRFVFHNGGTKILGYNWDYDVSASISKYLVDGYSSQIRFGQGGTLSFVVSPDGTAGNQITTEIYALHIANNGNVGIGTTNPNYPLVVSHTQSGYDYANIVSYSSGDGVGFGLFNPQRKWELVNIVSSGTDYFAIRDQTEQANRLIIDQDGNVGIGTTNPQNYKLAVNGAIIAEDITVQLHDNWVDYPDFVFSPKYKIMDLPKLEKYIKKNNHLPGIPTAQEVSETGIKLGEMNQKLLQKVEELTLYVIEQNKKIKAMEKEIQELKK